MPTFAQPVQAPGFVGGGTGTGGPPPATGQNIWYVDSNATDRGDAAGKGTSPDTPFSTIGYAVNATNNTNLKAGDHVYVLEGHAETITAAAGIDFDTAGVVLWGHGEGSRKPTVTLGTATTADVDVDAANVWIHGVRFVSDVDSLAIILDVNEDYCRITNCDFVSSSAKEYVNAINLATTKDYFYIGGCKFEQPTDPAGTDAAADTGAIFLVDTEYVTVERCEFYGNFETGLVHNRTTACKNLWIRDCFGVSDLSTAVPLTLVSTATGGIIRSHFISPNATDVTEAAVVGAINDTFFVFESTFGNDGAGGQLGVAGAAAAT